VHDASFPPKGGPQNLVYLTLQPGVVNIVRFAAPADDSYFGIEMSTAPGYIDYARTAVLSDAPGDMIPVYRPTVGPTNGPAFGWSLSSAAGATNRLNGGQYYYVNIKTESSKPDHILLTFDNPQSASTPTPPPHHGKHGK